MITSKNNRFGVYVILLVFCVLFLKSCSITDATWYKLSNPVYLAYEHQLDITLLNKLEQKDSFNLKKVHGGYMLYPITGMMHDYSLWINDSLLLLKVDRVTCEYTRFIHKLSSQILFEKELRTQRPQLKEDLLSDLAFYEKQYVSEKAREEYYRVDRYPLEPQQRSFHFHINDTLLKPVERLQWSGIAFGDTLSLGFKDGMQQGSFILKDSSQQLITNGNYEGGFEEGEWQIVDQMGALQWTEDWEKGELQKIKYAKGNTFTRPERLPTLKETIFLHRAIFYFLGIAGIVLFYFYIKSFRKFTHAFKNTNAWRTLGIILLSPVLSVGTLLITLCLSLIMHTLLNGLFTWDLPSFDYAIFIIPYYFFAGLIYFMVTFRIQDILWHATFLMILILMLGEAGFLQRLGTGIW